MKQVRAGLWIMAIGIWLLVGTTYAEEPAKLNTDGFKKGCVCTGESYGGGARYEKVLVVAITPQGSDYWVFYPDHLEERHRRSDGTLIALRMPTEQFLKDGEFRGGKTGRLKCPGTFWGHEQYASADR